MILHPTRSEGGREGTETVSLVHVSESPGRTSGCSTLLISLAIDLDFLVLWKITLCKYKWKSPEKGRLIVYTGAMGVTHHRAPYPEGRGQVVAYENTRTLPPANFM